jgi:hypothetical protein
VIHTFQIVEAKPYHCGQMARLLRAEQGESVAAMGFDAHYELRCRFQRSRVRRAWLVDGRLAALGGLEGAILAPRGHLWLAVAKHAARDHALAMVKEARRQLDEFSRDRTELVTLLIGGDRPSLRFAIFLGFHPQAAESADRCYSPAARRDLLARLESEPGLRRPVGAGYAIPMRYHEEAA